MADIQILYEPDAEVLSTAQVTLSVLCCLNIQEIQQNLVTEHGLGVITLPGLPSTIAEFVQARNALMEAETMTPAPNNPSTAYQIGEDVKVAVMQSLTGSQRLAAFNAAAKLLFAAWPFLDTLNITETERLMFVREHVPHIIALRVNCVALEHTGLVPDLEICALLHEEAWLHMMQTTIDHMYLTCFYDGLPLASRILFHHQLNTTEQVAEVDFERLTMNQYRAESISASMLGLKGIAVERRLAWIGQLYTEINRRGLLEDRRTIPIKGYEIGMTQLYCDHVDDRTGIERSQEAARTIESLKGHGKYDWAMPHITLALLEAHCENNYDSARETLLPLLKQHTKRGGLIFDDLSSLQTGIILYAMGTVTYFNRPFTALQPSTASLHEALGFLRRAVDVLAFTHGEQALWTLAATYRMAVCLYDLGEYRNAAHYLGRVCLAFRGYHVRRGVEHDGGLDIMWQKARATWKLAAALMGVGTERVRLEAQRMTMAAVELYYEIDGALPSVEDREWDRKILPLYR